MELMSSLLLCAALAFPPLALDPILPDTLLGVRTSLIKKTIGLRPPFMDYTCKHCFDCMERAVIDFKFKPRSINKRSGTEDLPKETLTSYNEVVRDKRELDFKPDEITLKTKRGKSKKAKFNKTATVTKYNVDKQIIALKVKETQVAAEQLDDTPASTTCQVYSVKKSYPCDTPESDSILAAARRKVNKKSKKEKDKSKVTTSTATTKLIAPAYRKREVDNSQVPENFMPSIEELY